MKQREDLGLRWRKARKRNQFETIQREEERWC
jgi:hypothetical protein